MFLTFHTLSEKFEKPLGWWRRKEESHKGQHALWTWAAWLITSAKVQLSSSITTTCWLPSLRLHQPGLLWLLWREQQPLISLFTLCIQQISTVQKWLEHFILSKGQPEDLLEWTIVENQLTAIESSLSHCFPFDLNDGNCLLGQSPAPKASFVRIKIFRSLSGFFPPQHNL